MVSREPGQEEGNGDAADLVAPSARAQAERQSVLIRVAPLVVAVTVLFVGLGLWLSGALDTDNIRQIIGYPALWLIGFVTAGSIFIPIPGIFAVCVAATPAVGLNPFLVGAVSGSAEALGEFVGYLAGASGKSIVNRHRYQARIRDLLDRRGGILLTAFSSFPNPLFDIAGIAAGASGYPARKFLFFVFIGKAIKSTWISFGCMAGVELFQRLFGTG